MCLCIPSNVLEVYPDESSALVDTLGVQRQVSTHLISAPLVAGDHVLIHVGFAISKIDQQEAQESLETYRQLLAEMDEDDIKVLLQ
ncbi:HypC/HybG/HupF family hydrogenase formation chaperone [Photobacterium profundum]|jgi:hydrogenase expression/formation protein HypC|uniref:Hydrogenase assembly chaperone hypC/hupF n=1 Tax=Photobacterium profundum 3TCK TaxID=314280 RepID=Q1Z838_9GAMM|nr:HypC/HybG/HupF family hydrogenase formation chaperone [Photobacterium profundum]EAS44675.1 hydrogenase assembly chaperone hypC/hupF [Photobacterium profundum 3TCK]PSV60665.1 HypC/HybG/HupF family hydrogenase formation chaperone [Photobacterium profundum]